MDFYPAYRRDVKINEANLDKEDLGRLFDLAQAQLNKAVSLQIANLNSDLLDDFEALKGDITKVSTMSYQINKKMGDAIIGYDIPDVHSSSFPEQIESIFFIKQKLLSGPLSDLSKRLAGDFLRFPTKQNIDRFSHLAF